MKLFILASLYSMAYALPALGEIDKGSPPDVYPDRDRNCVDQKFKSFPYYATANGVSSCVCPSRAFIDQNGICRSCPSNGLGNRLNNVRSCTCQDGFTWNVQKTTCECTGPDKRILKKKCLVADANAPPDIYTNQDSRCMGPELKRFPFYATNRGVSSCVCPSTAFIDKNGYCRDCPPTVGWGNSNNNASSCVCRDGFTWDEQKNTCECTKGLDRRVVQNKCVLCPDANVVTNHYFLNSRGVCVRCPPGASLTDGGGCECPANKPQDPNTGYCQCKAPAINCFCKEWDSILNLDKTGPVACRKCLTWNSPSCGVGQTSGWTLSRG